jgi:hypothetical protein
MKYKTLTEKERINFLIYVLNVPLKKRKKGEIIFRTRWGNKTETGIIETVKEILCLN